MLLVSTTPPPALPPHLGLFSSCSDKRVARYASSSARWRSFRAVVGWGVTDITHKRNRRRRWAVCRRRMQGKSLISTTSSPAPFQPQRLARPLVPRRAVSRARLCCHSLLPLRACRGGVRACVDGSATTGICGYHSAPSPQPPVVSARSQSPAPPPPFVRMLPIRIRYAIGCGAGAGEASPSASPPSPPDSPLGGGGFAGRPEGAGWRLSSPYRCGARSRSRLRHPRRHVHITGCVYVTGLWGWCGGGGGIVLGVAPLLLRPTAAHHRWGAGGSRGVPRARARVRVHHAAAPRSAALPSARAPELQLACHGRRWAAVACQARRGALPTAVDVNLREGDCS